MNPNHIFSIRWIITPSFRPLIFFFVFIFSGFALASNTTAELFVDSYSSQSALGQVNADIVIRQRPVEISIDSLSDQYDELQLNLFQDVVLFAKLDHVETDTAGNKAWVGKVEGIENSFVSLVMSNGRLSGSVNLADVSYHIRPINNELHVIREIDLPALQETANVVDQELDTDIPDLELNEQYQAPAIQVPLLSNFLGTEEQQVLDLVNQERTVAGLNQLTADQLLTQAARNHSQDMSQNNYFSHTGQNGSSPGQRIAATGYSFNTWGENIAAGYTSAASVMNGWMNSSGHRANILKSNFCDIGIGYVAAGRFWTQTFARKQGVSSCQSVNGPTNPTTPNPPAPPVPASNLGNGIAKNFSLARNQTIEFIIQVPANVSNLKVTINGSGDADLYVKKTAINWPGDNGQHNSAEFKSPWVNGSNESVTFSAPAKATWHVLIHGYAPASGKITATWQQNNTGNTGSGSNPNVNVLQKGSAKAFSLARHQVLDYAVNVPVNAKNLRVIISGSGDADLYVKRTAINWPQDSGKRNLPEFKAPWINGSNESVLFSAPKTGQWHVLIHGYQAAQGNIRATWE